MFYYPLEAYRILQYCMLIWYAFVTFNSKKVYRSIIQILF
jgi:hypothetical protein